MNLKKKTKWFVTILIIFLISIVIGYNYVYKSHKTTNELTTNYIGKSSDFMLIVNTNSSNWVNKVVELSGKITEKDSLGIIIDNSIFCQFIHKTNSDNLQLNQQITIKGIVIGYDDLLEELKLNQCIIKN